MLYGVSAPSVPGGVMVSAPQLPWYPCHKAGTIVTPGNRKGGGYRSDGPGSRVVLGSPGRTGKDPLPHIPRPPGAWENGPAFRSTGSGRPGVGPGQDILSLILNRAGLEWSSWFTISVMSSSPKTFSHAMGGLIAGSLLHSAQKFLIMTSPSPCT